MTFGVLRARLLELVRARIRNGEMSERRLARLTGVSQPQMHNVLKGIRLLSNELADEILVQLHLTVADLTANDPADGILYHPVPLLDGALGEGMEEFQPGRTRGHTLLPAEMAEAAGTPIAARLGEDHRMSPRFRAGDLILIDRSDAARTHLLRDATYVAVTATGPRLRLLRRGESHLYLVAAAHIRTPAAWEAARNTVNVLDIVCGRVAGLVGWNGDKR